MPELIITLEQLRGMIGIKLYHNNRACQVIEVLEDGPSIVIQYFEDGIQENQHGEAHRKVPETLCIPVLSSNKSQLSDIFLSLDLIN
ncbi:MAG: hypothetical protein OEY78_11135 [Gammaproteobacteria bacterium]|nr:hypothetical protein [Gammaproteobacteria bacterium]